MAKRGKKRAGNPTRPSQQKRADLGLVQAAQFPENWEGRDTEGEKLRPREPDHPLRLGVPIDLKNQWDLRRAIHLQWCWCQLRELDRSHLLPQSPRHQRHQVAGGGTLWFGKLAVGHRLHLRRSLRLLLHLRRRLSRLVRRRRSQLWSRRWRVADASDRVRH